MKLGEALEELAAESETKLASLEAARERARQHRRKLALREEQLAAAKAELAAAPEPPDNTSELNELKKTGNEKNMDVLEAERLVEDIKRRQHGPEQSLAAAERRLREIDSVRGQKLSILAQRNPGILEGDRWVQDHGNLFHKPVLGPVLTLIECDDKDHQSYLQQSCKEFLFAAYITQDSRDRDTLNAKFKELRLTSINVDRLTYQNPDISHLAPHGITHRLDQVFRADPIVKQVLVDGAGIDKTFVAHPDMTGEQIEQVLKTTEVTRAFTPKVIFNKTKSRYSAEIGLSSQEVRPSRLFTVGTNAGERAAVADEIKGFRDDKATVDAQLAEANRKRVELMQQLKEITNRRNLLTGAGADARKRLESLRQKVATAQSLAHRERDAEDLAAVEARVAGEVATVTKTREAKATELVDAMTAFVRAMHSHAAAALCGKELGEQAKHMKEEFDRQADLSSNLRAQREALTKSCADTKERARRLKEVAEREAPMTEELKVKFAEWPVLVEELQESIRLVENEADAILCPNGMVLEEYKKRKSEIDTIGANLRDEEARLGTAQGDIGSIKDRWLPKLRELVDHVNENFKNNFAAIGCAGEVKLNEDAGEAFEQWKLEIWVKFRAATDMHVLDAHRQSGGERSVSTMLYLISLQELTRAPFRVVDEINQGMDPVNERKIFKRMTNAASMESTPQTFLLTPKLLNNLVYTEDCTVLCIFNGPWIEEMAKRWREIQSALQPVAAGPETP